MKLYRDATGVIVGTQYEAKRMGKGWVPIDVPVDKQGLIDYLNRHNAFRESVRDASIHSVEFTAEAGGTLAEEPLTLRHKTQAEVDKMFLSVDPAVRWVPGNGPTVDQMIETILDLDGFKLGNVACAVTERISQLTKALR